MPPVNLDIQAVADLDGIYDYIGIENHSLLAADRFLDALGEKLHLYALQPQMGELRPDLGEDIRIFSFDNYVVIYRPCQDGIDVLRILEGRRDYPALFCPPP